MNKNIDLVFIGGVPRSGTTLVQKILGFHSSISAGPEFDHLPAVARLYQKFKLGINNGRQKSYYSEDGLKDHFSSFILNTLTEVPRQEEYSILSEKTPSNIFAFEVLQELYPQAKFVIVVRDPKGVINSFQKVAARAEQFGDEVHLGKNLYDDIRLVNDYLSTADAFYHKNKSNCYLLYYEELLSKPEIELENLCTFLNVSFEADMLNLENENSESNFINKDDPSGRSWVSPDTYKSNINKNKVDDWKGSLPKNIARLIDRYFYMNRIKLLEVYDFEKKPFTISVLSTYFKEEILTRRFLKRVFYKIFKK